MSQVTTIPIVLYAVANASISADESKSRQKIKVHHPISRVVIHASVQCRPHADRETDQFGHLFVKTDLLGPTQNICTVSQNSHWTTVEFCFKNPISINSEYLFKLVDNDNASYAPTEASSLGLNIVCYE